MTSELLDELWDAKRTAEYLGTTEDVLARERQDRRGLPYVVIGQRRIRYRVSDIAAYVSANVVVPHREGDAR